MLEQYLKWPLWCIGPFRQVYIFFFYGYNKPTSMKISKRTYFKQPFVWSGIIVILNVWLK